MKGREGVQFREEGEEEKGARRGWWKSIEEGKKGMVGGRRSLSKTSFRKFALAEYCTLGINRYYCRLTT